MRFLVVVVLALVFVPVGLAGPPDGFRESPALGVKVGKIAGVAGAMVYCARSDQGWATFADEHLDSGFAWAFTSRSTREVLAAPWVCRPLEKRLRKQPVADQPLAVAMHTLVHESLHVRGISNEMVAECQSLRMLGAVARTQFGIRSAKRRAKLVRLARAESYCAR